jgi:excisionase family DNA binding protein
MSNQDHGDTWQKELLTLKEAAAYLRVSRVTVWRWCQRGLIPAFQIGRCWRIRRDRLLELGEVLEMEEDRSLPLETPRQCGP